ncbi:MAG TPA: 16S rRNA (cytidine(1402)-2'-O)-methyltransferase [Chthonomonadaceae bacterium]|nr:16S rRNA (cytidine(1402)-2'-O)-methyltransferase [Chthonomonadaceae bacterium]
MNPARPAPPRRATACSSSAATANVTAEEAPSPPSYPGTLYLVSTPIGNLEDISLRALRLLREVPLIAAEDARVTRKLLDHFGIGTEVVSYRSSRQPHQTETLLAALHAGRDLALVSDAGTPAIADPGASLITAAIARGIPVQPVPGPVAALSALVASGLPAGRFAFDGFPPRRRADRRAFFAALARESRTLLLYESPAYLPATLRDLLAALGRERPVAIVRDLTRSGETCFRGTLAQAVAHFRTHTPRGEYTLVIGGLAASGGISLDVSAPSTE